MVARAGGLDQGNIILNLDDIKRHGYNPDNFLMLSGSAVNEWRNESGKYDPRGGAVAMQQAIEVYEKDEFEALPVETHVERLYEYANEHEYKELAISLKQRYPQNLK